MNITNVSLSQAAGYFHWSPVWIKNQPESQDSNILNEPVFSITLSSNISATVLRQGIFTFDFSKTTLGYVDSEHDWIKNPDKSKSELYMCLAIPNAHPLKIFAAA